MKNGIQLNDRILWFDGDSSIEPQKICEYILSGFSITSNMFVTEYDKHVRQFNALNPDTPLVKKTEYKDITTDWDIPEKYKKINVSKYLLNKLLQELEKNNQFTQSDIEERIERVEYELELYKEYELIDILKVVIYIVEEFENNNVVWGTGRGSSCCSYCLYLIGLHDVDSIEYDLELNEFFR
ncbi:MAG: hypothetical protein ACRCZC_06775 [Culicoidibacterales bacterium]